MAKKINTTGPATCETAPENGFWAKYGPNIVLGGLIVYVILLAIGTIADIFKIQSILDWWLWRNW